MPTPPANAITSSFHLGTYNTQTDSFTQVLDLNDGATFRIHPKSLKLAQPDKTIVETGNIRAPGASVARWQYKNRHIQVEVSLRGNSTSALLASLRALLAAVEQPPYTIRLALPGATQYSYADVVAVKHDIPSDTQQILVGAITRIHLDFECRPGLRGDRVTLQNLVVNSGFEAPSDVGVTVFNEGFTNTNAYTLVGGTPPSVAGNLMTIPSGATVTFGSPSWGAINTWQVRFQWVTGQQSTFYLHRVDGNNYVDIFVSGTSIFLSQRVAGTTHDLTNATISLTTGNFYYLKVTQFPAATGFSAYITVALFNDSGGTVGSQVTSIAAPTFDGVTALSGVMGFFANSGALAVGGTASTSLNSVQLFGPGGWVTVQNFGTGIVSGAWEQNTANTSTAGPVTSYGAARFEFPPAGTASVTWSGYTGGAPSGSVAIPVAAGQTLGVSFSVRSTGLSASASCKVIINEYDNSGTFLRQTNVGTITGNVTSWTIRSGTITTGTSCAYVATVLSAADTSAPGASANATVWFDNVQVWNQTTTGMSSMPYCELRFLQGPSSLVVSGLAGDMVAPALCSLGLPVSGWGPGSTITYAVGRRPYASANFRGVGSAYGRYDGGASPQATAILDSASYGGYYAKATLATKFEPIAFGGMHTSDLQGTYQLWHRFQTSQTTVANVVSRSIVNVQQLSQPWIPTVNPLTVAFNPFNPTISAANTWTLCNAGLAVVPPFSFNPTADPTQTYMVPYAQLVDTTNNGATGSENWEALIPVDGPLVTGIVNNPSNSGTTVTNIVWLYLDGLGEPVSSGPLDRVSPYAATYSIESGPLANPGAGVGSIGNQNTAYINVNGSADPYLTLDPTLDTGSGAAQIGVNQLVAFMATNAATISPLYCEMAYSPLYLYPR